jgi:hypothetical protein
MILEEAFPGFLLTVPEISAIVGNQIYGVMRPQGERPLPEILIARTSTAYQQKFCGVDGLANADMQLDCYGYGLEQAMTLANTVRKALKDFSGMMLDVVVQKVFLTNQFPSQDPDPGCIRVTQTYNFWYVED